MWKKERARKKILETIKKSDVEVIKLLLDPIYKFNKVFRESIIKSIVVMEKYLEDRGR